MAEILQHLYQLLGRAVLLPIPLRQKGPKLKEWQTVTFELSKTPDYQQELAECAVQGGNIGVLLGPASDDLHAIDIDDDELAEMFVADNPVLATTLRTHARRGCQFWLRPAPGTGFPNSKATYALKTSEAHQYGEWRCGGAGGAQSVIFGIHPEGVQYQIVIDREPAQIDFYELHWFAPWEQVSRASDALVNLDKRITSYLDTVVESVQGEGGSNPTFRVACLLVNGFALDGGQALHYLRYYSEMRCRPPWTETEMAHKLADALKAPHIKPRGYLLQQDNVNDRPKIEIQSFESLPEDLPEEVIHGLVRRSEVLLIGGHSKSWKSWATLDLLFCAANGIDWLRFPTAQGQILHLDLELLAADLRRRFTAIRESYNEKGSFENLHIASLRGRSFNLGDLDRIAVQLAESAFSLASLDPTYRLLGSQDESAPGVITDLMNRFLTLGTKLKAAICILQHFAKGNASAKESIDRFSGSGVWGRHPDALVTFTQHEEEDCFTVECTLRSFPPIEPFGVRWEYPRFRIDESLDPERLRQPKGGRPKLSSAEQLAGLIHADESISYTDLQRRAEKLCQMKKSTFDRRLRDAKMQKLIYLSPINNEYSLTSEYLKHNGQTI